MKENKPNCYECKWRVPIPGSAHSECTHPVTKETLPSDRLRLFVTLRAEMDVIAAEKLGIKADPHGIKNGWFNWPWNFDPVWLEACDGYEPTEEPKGGD